jgi:Family of unknown function (DUF6533)
MADIFTPIVAHLRAGVYTCAAAGTILLYDMLLTSKDEIRLIWPSKFSLVKCLYLVVGPPKPRGDLDLTPCLESLPSCTMFAFGNVPYVSSPHAIIILFN